MNIVSIITVTYNAAAHLQHCLDTVHKQNVNVEHIVIDGASTDATLEILESNKDKLAHVISEKDNGMYDALNKGIRLASGEVIGILNADDFYPSNDILSKVMMSFSNKGVEAVYGDLLYVDGSNTDKIIRHWKSGNYNPNKFYWGWMPPHPTFFVRRAIYDKYGLFNLKQGTAADYELMLRMLLKHRIKIEYIPEVLVKMRSGGMSNVSFSNRIRANQMDRKAWSINGLKPYPWTLMMKPLRKIGQWIFKN